MKKINPALIDEIFARFAGHDPHPKTELNYTNPFTLLVAVVLSAQATDKGVNKATPALFAAADTPQKMLALGEDQIREHVKSIGFFRMKARNVHALSAMLVNNHAGEVPHDRTALEALPGVGRKTANVVLNAVWGDPTLAVDTHVFRVAHRLGLSQGKKPDDVERDLLKIIPDKYMQHAHHWLVLHGRYICKARKPDCANCPLADICPSCENL